MSHTIQTSPEAAPTLIRNATIVTMNDTSGVDLRMTMVDGDVVVDPFALFSSTH